MYSVLVFPREAVARDVARELSDAGCRLVAVRASEGEGLWDVASLAVYPVPEEGPELLVPLVQHEKRGLAALARSRGGALLTHLYSSAGGVPAFSRKGLVHEDATARIALPDPLPGPRPLPPRAPQWEGLYFGNPGTEIREAVAVAKRMYGTPAAAPHLLEFLMDDASPEGLEEDGEGTREFLADLVRMAHHMPTRDDGAVLIIPYLAELARSQALSPGARASLLHVLLGFASELDAAIAGFADWSAMGGRVELRYFTRLRDAVVAQVPRLVPLWERESDAARLVLVALAAFCPAQTASLVRPRLADIPAPQGTDRADALALAAALLGEDTDALDTALRQMATWDDAIAEQLESPHTPRPQAARTALAACVRRDLPVAVKLP
ncbi:hypothetical protein E6W39_09835 [Kitasatospora acidiphila]|uniref:Uncharacterized protein n=1 Tax=Kitasatospora acidiphila TaxID=2567942 RepID=A0A540W0I1_9ACTN|nr:hypothetical protein [Kitasatospora acidiphila]TQF02520.1 hypothetical protein E6W39_09835 [Kitasatospora acidiphila]